MRKRTLLMAAGALVLIIAAGAAWYLGSPLFIDRTVEEEFPFQLPSQAEMEVMAEGEREALATEVLGTAAAMPDKPMEEPMPGGEQPTALRSGSFAGADNFHQGSGTATIFELPDGSRVLRLEEFMVTNGPDLHVLLATGAAVSGQADLGEYIDLGPLKGNIGNQNYEIPLDLDLGPYRTVVVYCVPFHVVFATAGLAE